MQFDIITIFPKIFNSYFNESILSRAQKNKLIKINIHNLRNYADDKRKTVDDTTYGGGAGMVLKVEPIYKALLDIVGKKNLKCFKKKLYKNKTARKKKSITKVIVLSAKGKKFDQAMAKKFSKLDRIVLICGRYEGIDERVSKYLADEEISIGDYVLTGGEIPAMIVVDSVSRMIGGVLGNKESIEDESFTEKEILEHPHYTKPEIFFPDKKTKWQAPKILLSGNHKEIEKWREKHKRQVK